MPLLNRIANYITLLALIKYLVRTMSTYLKEAEFVGSLVRAHDERSHVTDIDITTGDCNGCGGDDPD